MAINFKVSIEYIVNNFCVVCNYAGWLVKWKLWTFQWIKKPFPPIFKPDASIDTCHHCPAMADHHRSPLSGCIFSLGSSPCFLLGRGVRQPHRLESLTATNMSTHRCSPRVMLAYSVQLHHHAQSCGSARCQRGDRLHQELWPADQDKMLRTGRILHLLRLSAYVREDLADRNCHCSTLSVRKDYCTWFRLEQKFQFGVYLSGPHSITVRSSKFRTRILGLQH